MADKVKDNKTKKNEDIAAEKASKKKKLLITYAVIIAIIGLGCALLYSFLVNYIKAIPDVRVPNVVGLDVYDAEYVLKKYKLEPFLGGSRFSEEAQPNIILATDPEAGSIVKSGRKILYIVNSGQEKVSLHDIKGLYIEQATELLMDYNVMVTTFDEVFSSEYKEGTIISTSPNIGEYIQRNTVIEATISKGFPVSVSVHKIAEGENKALVKIALQMPAEEATKKNNIKIVTVANNRAKPLYNEKVDSGKDFSFEFEETLGNRVDVFLNDIQVKTFKVIF